MIAVNVASPASTQSRDAHLATGEPRPGEAP